MCFLELHLLYGTAKGRKMIVAAQHIQWVIESENDHCQIRTTDDTTTVWEPYEYVHGRLNAIVDQK